MLSAILPESGNLFFWGCNKYGQSTQDPRTTSQVNVPYQLGANLFTGKVVEIKSGWTHLVAKTGTSNFLGFSFEYRSVITDILSSLKTAIKPCV